MTGDAAPVALVTGASSGIGRAIALELAARGHDLVVTARRRPLLEALAAEVEARFSRRAEVIPADLATRSGREKVENRIAAGIQVLVANAGFSTRGSFPRLALEREVEEIEVNVVSTVRLCHAAACVMSGAGRGRILITSSAASFQPLPGLATYGASKAYLTSFAQALHAELKPLGVSVTCLAPGYTIKASGQARPDPAWAWSTSAEVAKAGVDALLADRALVVPGLPWKVVALLAPRLPRSVVSLAAGAVARRILASESAGSPAD